MTTDPGIGRQLREPIHSHLGGNGDVDEVVPQVCTLHAQPGDGILIERLRIGRQQIPFDAVDHVDPQLLIQPGHRIGLKSVDAPLGRPYVLRNAGPPGRTPDRCHDIPPHRWRRRR
ncbi:hypothetical protein G6F40_017253 [Rhizopus arrhizus]|nr:hypothetical protein G6F40_017253 [Rhizopus arrhizus]